MSYIKIWMLLIIAAVILYIFFFYFWGFRELNTWEITEHRTSNIVFLARAILLDDMAHVTGSCSQ